MEAGGQASGGRPSLGGLPPALLALAPLALIAAALGLFALFGQSALPERTGPAVEELAVERTVLRPGEIELSLRNPGPDPVTVGQVFVNDVYVDFDIAQPEVPPLGSEALRLDFPWQEGSPLLVTVLTATGVTIEHEIPAAVATPELDGGFLATMTLLGTYVGVVPVLLGMLFLPLLAAVSAEWIRLFMAFTVGLLAFLALDAGIEGIELGQGSAGAFGGPALPFLGAALAFLALTALDRRLSARRRALAQARGGYALALLIAVGIGLHNLGEGLAIGSAYAVGELALGAFLVVGFALHNTTEGLAIVAPLASARRPGLVRLLGLGLIAGAPAILGALVGAATQSAELAAFLLGVGVGAIVGVIGQLLPAIRDAGGRVLHPLSVAGIIGGALVLYLTGLVVSV